MAGQSVPRRAAAGDGLDGFTTKTHMELVCWNPFRSHRGVSSDGLTRMLQNIGVALWFSPMI
jgi:hypothetical protein